MPSTGQILREYVAVHGCVRALTTAFVAVMVAVRHTERTSRPAPLRDALLRQAAVRAAQTVTAKPQTDDHALNDLQQRILAPTSELRRRGHPLDARPMTARAYDAGQEGA